MMIIVIVGNDDEKNTRECWSLWIIGGSENLHLMIFDSRFRRW